jgi:hypothetical protein
MYIAPDGLINVERAIVIVAPQKIRKNESKSAKK